ncbi:hypothetical protein BO99DRAFT_451202 [Aspergillus violaceofuscus CBS 115571]|uniref:Uncharacterized protein n=1 Tax=Aspergillus violaceofuscus (strain CBS 115571) TaxID=1450538 RepID=A0A2V5GXZ0_ASPV1|nr:hypothetical protein BO99DRAFT_451202 [Aspergillus violaceofuscus CBS 115571]
MQDPSTTAWATPMPNPAMIDPHCAQQARMRNFLEENAWLNALPISASDLNALRSIQGLYEVRIDKCPWLGASLRLWLIWDYDRLWGSFTFTPLEGVFLIEPAYTIEDCDPATGFSPSLPVRWIGWAGPNGFDREDTSTIPSGMRINPWKKTLEGEFGFMWGCGWPGPGTVSFRATRLPGVEDLGWQGIIDLEDIVGEWAQREPYGEKERIRQTLSPEELEAELHERDAARVWARAGEESLNEEAGEDDELSLLSECFSTKGDVAMAVFDRSGNSIQIRLWVHTKYNRVWGEFDGDFRMISFVNLQTRDKHPAPAGDSSTGEVEDSHLLSLLARLLLVRETLSAQVFDKMGNSMPICLREDDKVVVSGEFDGDFATLSLMK